MHGALNLLFFRDRSVNAGEFPPNQIFFDGGWGGGNQKSHGAKSGTVGWMGQTLDVLLLYEGHSDPGFVGFAKFWDPFFFKHSWWRHILNRVKQPHDWWGQHNFVLADGVRFKVSSDTSSNHVAYTLYNWQDREHLGMNIPRPERKAERVGGCILSAVAHSCKYCTFVLANNHVTQPSIDSKKWQESTSRVRPCALRVQLYVPLLTPLHPTPCSQPQAFLPSCTQSRQRNWIVCSRLPDKHALLAEALIGCSMGPGYFASNRRV